MSIPEHQATPFKWHIAIPHVGRQMSDQDWQIWEPSYVARWKAAQEIYSIVKMNYNDKSYVIKFDFSNIINAIQHLIAVMTDLVVNKNPNAYADFSHEGAIISVECISILDKFDKKKKYDCQCLVEILLYEIFLVMNISAPGSCDLSRSNITSSPPEFGLRSRLYQKDINLHNWPFESSIYEIEKFPWLRLKSIDVLSVSKWIRHHSHHGKMIPETSAARCLFALFYLSKTDVEPTSIIWIFYALESIFQCKVGDNFVIAHLVGRKVLRRAIGFDSPCPCRSRRALD